MTSGSLDESKWCSPGQRHVWSFGQSRCVPGTAERAREAALSALPLAGWRSNLRPETKTNAPAVGHLVKNKYTDHGNKNRIQQVLKQDSWIHKILNLSHVCIPVLGLHVYRESQQLQRAVLATDPVSVSYCHSWWQPGWERTQVMWWKTAGEIRWLDRSSSFREFFNLFKTELPRLPSWPESVPG